MNTLRLALTTIGAMAALVGGAETATWGLGPLAGPVAAAAPKIVAAEAKTVTSDVTPPESNAPSEYPESIRVAATAIPPDQEADTNAETPVAQDGSGASPDLSSKPNDSAPSNEADNNVAASEVTPG